MTTFFASVMDSIRAAVAVDHRRRLVSLWADDKNDEKSFKTTTVLPTVSASTPSAENAAVSNEKLASQRSSCRTCTDFQTYVMNRRSMSNYKDGGTSEVQQSQQGQSGDAARDEAEYRRKNCPLDKDELGRSTWNLLHTMASTFPEQPTVEQSNNVQQFLSLLSRVYPCEICAGDFAEIMKYHPPRTESQESLSQWMCEVHNMVNRKLDKPQFDCTKVIERWRDGWKDGRCD